ncbi:MAG: aminotransferase class III-fold pyridoxal phosphate-dependent enzyme [Candidatus Binatia bacterium]
MCTGVASGWLRVRRDQGASALERRGPLVRCGRAFGDPRGNHASLPHRLGAPLARGTGGGGRRRVGRRGRVVLLGRSLLAHRFSGAIEGSGRSPGGAPCRRRRAPAELHRRPRDKFDLATVVTESRGPRLRDLDDNWTLDVGGSYGVNLAGYERYKRWIEAASERVRDLGPVLGPLHPVVTENIAILKSISKLDELSFHASGTEAVMPAVRLVRFNTGRKLIVCFSGSYHGWWDGVQPGLGSERAIDDCLTRKELSPASLEVIRRRAGEIAGVLVNPVQSFHPNSPPPTPASRFRAGAVPRC